MIATTLTSTTFPRPLIFENAYENEPAGPTFWTDDTKSPALWFFKMIETPNLLVTDDDVAFRRVVCEGLSRRGFRVTEAGDGAEALDVMKRDEIHVALVDLHMPRLTGLDVIRCLSETPESPPCVLMSAKLDDMIRAEAKRMRAFDVLSKPVRLQHLTEVIGRILEVVYGWHPSR